MKKDFPTFCISQIEPGIALIEYKGLEMGLPEIIQLYDEIEAFGKGKKIAILNTFHEFVPSNDDATRYAAGDRPPKFIYASAIVVKSLAIRLTIMMFMRFNKQKVPRKVFNSKKKALDWLKKMKSANSRSA